MQQNFYNIYFFPDYIKRNAHLACDFRRTITSIKVSYLAKISVHISGHRAQVINCLSKHTRCD